MGIRQAPIVKIWSHFLGEKINEKLSLKTANIFIQLIRKIGFDLTDQAVLFVLGKFYVAHKVLLLFVVVEYSGALAAQRGESLDDMLLMKNKNLVKLLLGIMRDLSLI